MRILHCYGSLLPNHDGVTRVAYKLKELFSEEHDHYYISPQLPDFAPKEMLPVRSLPLYLSTNYRISLFPGARILNTIKSVQPDVIHIHSPCSLGFSATRIASSLGIPVVATYHTHFPTYLSYYKVNFLEPLIWGYLRTLYSACKTVIVPSTKTLSDLKNGGLKNLLHIPHGVDIKRFSPEFRSEEWRKKVGGEKIICFAGRLVWEKNLRLLAEAAKQLETRKDLRFVVIGDGPARKELETLMPHAHFTGFITGTELSVAYASSDLFVFPSVTETFGNVIVEAMASGLPSIAAGQGGAVDMIEPNKNGALISGKDPRELATAIQDCIGNDWKKSAIETAKRFDWRETTKRYENLYISCLRATPAAAKSAASGFRQAHAQ
jgi:phosphatidylinositol alpha 1,6-mannosyltransferase